MLSIVHTHACGRCRGVLTRSGDAGKFGSMEAIGQAGNGCQEGTEGAMVCCKRLRLPTGGVSACRERTRSRPALVRVRTRRKHLDSLALSRLRGACENGFCWGLGFWELNPTASGVHHSPRLHSCRQPRAPSCP
jgi:hypothetical protein